MKWLLGLLPCILLSACVYHQQSYERIKGVEISPQQVSLVESGKTTKQWVLTNFGIPDRIQVEPDGTEVFEYISERTVKSKKAFIFLFAVDSDKTTARKVTRVVMRDTIVTSVTTVDQ
jgi:outer membrane protein assembly factor BamE (lipoprotein component of BamABCDE complex)